jgi:putative nucleotidyltransferase with HDIG domain
VSAALDIAREELAGLDVWLVGGAVRDHLLGRETDDIDLVVDGEVEAAARALARGRGTAFALSDAFGAWRVVVHGRTWQADLSPLRGGSIDADLRLRDFTVNAMAEPLAGGDVIDPLGGARDAADRVLRMTSAQAFADDPLRTLRLARMACELELAPTDDTVQAAVQHAPGLADVSPERTFAELKRVVASDDPRSGIELMGELGVTAVVLPELGALRGVEQNPFHHLDVYEHSLAVLDECVALERDPAASLGPESALEVSTILREPLADELTRGEALRFGALLHDAAKPATRGVRGDGRVTFIGHDVVGADLARDVLGRLRASEKLRTHVAELTRHHLRLGFLVHDTPLPRRSLYRYLAATDAVAVDVTLLSVADRLATRGENADAAIARHLELAREVLRVALVWRAHGPPEPLLPGDQLARELGIDPGPEIGRLLRELAEAQFAGEVTTREEALAAARALAAR